MRSLPIRLAPIPGEGFDSWVAAYASRLQTPVHDVVGHLGLDAGFVRRPFDVVVDPNIADATALGAAGLSAEQVEAMVTPLARYRAAVEGRFTTPWLKRAARPLRWSRFCPACLHRTDGRWQAAWRLPWHVACSLHACLLASRCAACGRVQRRTLVADVEACPTICEASPGVGHHVPRCRQDLSDTADMESAPAGVVDLQASMAPLLDPSVDDAAVAVAVDLLADMFTVARHLDEGLISATPENLADTAGLSALLDGAWLALKDTGDQRLGAIARADVKVRPPPLPQSWCTASPALVSRVLHARDAHLRPSDRIRWRSTTAEGRRPRLGAGDRRREGVPSALWADWVVRLRPPHIDPPTFAKVGAGMLLVPGSSASLGTLFEGWTPDPRLARTSSHVLQTVAADAHGRAVLRALTQLGDGLLVHGCPIDYRRRDGLASSATLIDASAWDEVCAISGTPTGGALKLRCARLWIWETITGGLLERAPQRLRPDKSGDVSNYHRFALRLPPPAAELLDGHARRFLDAEGCGDEPLTWSPPSQWVDLDGLPGRDPASVTPEQVEVLLRQRLSPSAVARRLATTLDHVHLIVRQQPPHLRPRATGSRPTPVRCPFPAELTPQRLHQLVIVERRTLRSIARDYGLGRNALAHALRREGIPTPNQGRAPRRSVEAGWLHREYVEHLRPLTDIAAELEMSPTNLARIARRLAIPVRGSGGGSHSASLVAPDGWPLPLADAVLGQGGRLRIKRFQVYARTRSLNEASPILCVRSSILQAQLAQLERACGGGLLTRETRQHDAQCLTRLGRLLLEQADTHLGAHPDAPPPLPEPIASAVASYRGRDRLRRLQVTAQASTLAEAAAMLGTDPYTLGKSINGLERACKGILLESDSPGRLHRVTPLGSHLLEQSARYLPVTVS